MDDMVLRTSKSCRETSCDDCWTTSSLVPSEARSADAGRIPCTRKRALGGRFAVRGAQSDAGAVAHAGTGGVADLPEKSEPLRAPPCAKPKRTHRSPPLHSLHIRPSFGFLFDVCCALPLYARCPSHLPRGDQSREDPPSHVAQHTKGPCLCPLSFASRVPWALILSQDG